MKEAYEVTSVSHWKNKLISIRKLREWTEVVSDRQQEGKATGSGPIKAVLNALEELQWKMKDPFEMQDDKGVVHTSTLITPAYIRRKLDRSVDRKQLREIRSKLECKVWRTARMHAWK